ncbi:hypothetical protein E9229_001565 [Paeniglutamicibacter cryotolerans]|uniref:Uncharacterized protein n=1 Tax=Paeniglutamicibacter cryotolerans TaxID=670079 RepID=A0A839QKT0_9MICC|nr:hypothetical protein [Paeniglutamicibacter cryotolerans]
MIITFVSVPLLWNRTNTCASNRCAGTEYWQFS